MKIDISYSTCNCTNQNLLALGQTCEICMGVIESSENLSQLLPETHFDESYFEMLELFFESQTVAA